MIHVTCRLTAKNWDQLRNPTLGNRVWAAFTFLTWQFGPTCTRQCGSGYYPHLGLIWLSAELSIVDVYRQQALFHVLAAYSMYNTDVGYCQGMSQIAALLLMYFNEEVCSVGRLISVTFCDSRLGVRKSAVKLCKKNSVLLIHQLLFLQ